MAIFDRLFKKRKKEVLCQSAKSTDRTNILMMSQLAALYINEKDEKYHQRYVNDLVAANVPKKEAQAMFEFDCSVIEKYKKEYLLHPDFTLQWIFDLQQPFLRNILKKKRIF